MRLKSLLFAAMLLAGFSARAQQTYMLDGNGRAVGIGGPNGMAQLGADGKVLPNQLPVAGGAVPLDNNGNAAAASLINRPTIAPLTTTVSNTATTVFPAGTYVSIRIALTATGSLACTGDSTAPVLGGSGQASFGQTIFWPVSSGGPMPASAVRCIAAAPSTITATAY